MPIVELSEVLRLLDDPEVTEIVLSSGQHVTIRKHGGYKAVGAAPLSADDIVEIVAGSPVAQLVARGDGDNAPLQLHGRAVRVEANRFGARIVVRIVRGPRGTSAIPRSVEQPAATQPLPRTEPELPVRPSAPELPVRPSAPELPVRPSAPEVDPRSVSRPAKPSFVAFKQSAPRPAAPRPAAEPVAPVPAPEAFDLDLDLGLPGEPPASSAEPVPDLPLAPARGGRARSPSQQLPPPPRRRTTISPPIASPLPPLRERASGAMPELVALVEQALRYRATDLHVAVGRPPMLRTGAGLTPLGEPLDADDVDALLVPLLTGTFKEQLDERGYIDAAVDLGATGRLRMNLSRTRDGLKGAFRIVMAAPPTLEQLGIPPELAKITTYHQGLVLIAGPNGHGKTTTMAALVDLINRTKAHHILTVEDPVEIIHPRKKAVISQREVGTHTRSFATALKASLREDPDVIVIGELRDRETVEIALTAAETGHLVMATTSTPSAAKTLDRLIDMFPPADQQQVRSSLAAALKFVLAQRLLPGADGHSLVAATELVTGVLPLAAMIRDDKLFQLDSLLQRGRAFGMIRLDDSLAELVKAGRITEQVAARYAQKKGIKR